MKQIMGDSGGQGSLVCCSPWGHKESDMIEQLNIKSKSDKEGESLEPAPCFRKASYVSGQTRLLRGGFPGAGVFLCLDLSSQALSPVSYTGWSRY